MAIFGAMFLMFLHGTNQRHAHGVVQWENTIVTFKGFHLVGPLPTLCHFGRSQKSTSKFKHWLLLAKCTPIFQIMPTRVCY